MPLGSIVRALVLSAVVAASAQAQESRPFRDSWFWGAKVGTLSLATNTTNRTWAPSIGAEWFITRSAGGLWVFADHTSFDVTSEVEDGSTATGRRRVDLRNLRRVGFAAIVSPRAFGRARPYAGLGMALNVIGRAAAQVDSVAGAPSASLEKSVDDERSRATVIGLAGAQAQFARTAVFSQLTVMPGNRRFLLNDGPMVGIDLGVRYNFGSSIAR